MDVQAWGQPLCTLRQPQLPELQSCCTLGLRAQVQHWAPSGSAQRAVLQEKGVRLGYACELSPPG